MTHFVDVRESQVFGGLVVPRVAPGFEVGNGDLVKFLQDRLRDRRTDQADVYTVYLPDSAGQYNALIAFPYESVDGIPLGDVFALVPKAVYAVFKPNGEFADPLEDVWTQAKSAIATGTVERARTEDIEILRSSGEVELHISIKV